MACQIKKANQQMTTLSDRAFLQISAAGEKHMSVALKRNPSNKMIVVMIRTAGADSIAEVFSPRIPLKKKGKSEKPSQR
jgi:hypothetical protein